MHERHPRRGVACDASREAQFVPPGNGDPSPDPWIGALFGADVRTLSCATSDDLRTGLVPAEAALAATYAPRRQREFAAGRACARRLLAGLGVPAVAIGRDAHRAPCWPDGIVGSISHGAGLCVVAVARRGAIVGLGVDVEAEAPLSAGIQRRVCTPAERRRLAVLGEPEAGRRAKLLFSIKEAIYKCIHPLVQTPIGFQQADIQIDVERGLFTVEPVGASPEVSARLAAVEGAFAWREGRVLSGATLRAPGPSGERGSP